jgi:hypothetical protein
MKNTPNFGKASAATATLALLLVFATFSATAQADNKNDLDVNVSVADKTIIDIQPSSFSWGFTGSGVNPGSLAGPGNETNGYGRIQVENLGSVNISQVWFNTTAPSERPFGTADRSLYDSANFITLGNLSGSAPEDRNSQTFVNRVEYGLDQPTGQDIIYLQTPSDWDYGRFRNGSQEYFWTVDDTGTIDGATFRIGVDHHNSTQTGSVNLDDTCSGGEGTGSNNECNEYTLNTGNGYAYTEVEVGAEDTNTPGGPDTPNINGGALYCVVMDSSQVGGSNPPEVQFVKWNKGHPAASSWGNDCAAATQYLVGGGSSELAPGAWVTMNIRANVPYGVVSGSVPTGQLTVLANSN